MLAEVVVFAEVVVLIEVVVAELDLPFDVLVGPVEVLGEPVVAVMLV